MFESWKYSVERFGSLLVKMVFNVLPKLRRKFF